MLSVFRKIRAFAGRNLATWKGIYQSPLGALFSAAKDGGNYVSTKSKKGAACLILAFAPILLSVSAVATCHRKKPHQPKRTTPAATQCWNRQLTVSPGSASWADFYSRNSGGSGLRTSERTLGPISNRFGVTPTFAYFKDRKRGGASLQCVGLGLAIPHAGSRPIFIARLAAKNSRAARHSGACGGHEERFATLNRFGRRAQ